VPIPAFVISIIKDSYSQTTYSLAELIPKKAKSINAYEDAVGEILNNEHTHK